MKTTNQADALLADIEAARRRVLTLLGHRNGGNQSEHSPTAVRRRLLLADMLTDQAERIVRFRESRLR